MAGRTPKPWYRADRNEWVVTIRGVMHRLGSDRAKAYQHFHELMAGGGVELPSGGGCGVGAGAPPAVSFGAMVADYLNDFRTRVGGRTHYVARCYLTPITRQLGKLPADKLTPAHVDAAVRGHHGWNATTQHHVCCRIVAVFNWAVRRGTLTANPLKGMRKPTPRTRGAAAMIPSDNVAKLIEAAPEYLRDVLIALRLTGARPCEVLSVTAADFDPAAGVWILREHKTAGKTGAPRVVFLPAEVVERCKVLAARNPAGPLFRRQLGTPFPSSCYLARLVRNLRRKLGLSESIIPYGFRHTFATDALAGGVPEAHVAELLGHKGTAMLHKHYAHLGTKANVLRAALGKVRG